MSQSGSKASLFSTSYHYMPLPRSVVYRVQFSSILTSHFITRVNFERVFIGNIMAATVKQFFKTFVGPFMLLKSIFVLIGRKTNCPLTLNLSIDCEYLFQLISG